MPVFTGGPFPQEWFEDFALDQVFEYGAYAVTEDAILAHIQRYREAKLLP